MRKSVAAIIAAVVFAFTIMFAPAAATAEELPVSGCVLSGGGWIGNEPCPDELPPNPAEPVEPAPVEPGPEPVEPSEPAPAPPADPEPVVEPAPEPEPVSPAPAEVVAPIVVEAAPRVPIFNDPCGTANDSWTDPGNTPDAPWQYFETEPSVGDPGYVYAVLPDTHVMPNGNRTWYPVWEKVNVFTDAPCPIEGPPPAPIFNDPCGVDNVVVTLPQSDIWSYEIVRDEVGGSGQVIAYLPEGFVIAGQGGRFWDPVFEFRDSQIGCPPAVVPETPAADIAAPPAGVDELAATGPADLIPAAVIAAMFLGLGVTLFTLNHLRRRRVQ